MTSMTLLLACNVFSLSIFDRKTAGAIEFGHVTVEFDRTRSFGGHQLGEFLHFWRDR